MLVSGVVTQFVAELSSSASTFRKAHVCFYICFRFTLVGAIVKCFVTVCRHGVKENQDVCSSVIKLAPSAYFCDFCSLIIIYPDERNKNNNTFR